MKGSLCLLTIICCCILLQAPAQQVKYVVLISIDGARPEFYNDTTWHTPTLQYLKAGGTCAAGVNSIFPSVTYPAHATLVTGVLPAQHGVYYNEVFDPIGQSNKWYWEASNIKVPTLWDAVHKAGMTSAAIMWPVSVGAPIDHNIPEVWWPGNNTEKIAPIRDKTTPAGFFAEIETQVTGKLTSDDVNSNYLRMDSNSARMAAYLIRTCKPNLLAVHLVCADNYQHQEGRNGPRVKMAVMSADHAVAIILEAVQLAGIKDSTAIIITGDHGFVDVHTSLAPNVWLAEHGLIVQKDGKTEGKAMFHTSGSSAFLLLQHKGDNKTLAAVNKILAELPAEKRKLFSIVSASSLKKRGAAPDAVLALNPAPA